MKIYKNFLKLECRKFLYNLVTSYACPACALVLLMGNKFVTNNTIPWWYAVWC